MDYEYLFHNDYLEEDITQNLNSEIRYLAACVKEAYEEENNEEIELYETALFELVNFADAINVSISEKIQYLQDKINDQ